MATKNYKTEFETALSLAKLASEGIRNVYYGNMETTIKRDGTPVTNADLLANEIIVSGLQKYFPQDGIVSEEMDEISGGRTWHIDPIDGTKGFIYRSNHFAIHIGLVEDGKPVFGMVYKPLTDEFYFSAKGKGAFRVAPSGGKKRLEVSKESFEKFSLVANMSFTLERPNLYKMLNPSRNLLTGSQGLRMMKIAEGLGDVHVFDKPKLGTWDLCAPQAIVEEAGGYVSTVAGNEVLYDGNPGFGRDVIVARTKDLGEHVGRIVKEYRNM
jgi:3'(2'), 5'-bisphosphate nucleotidase